MKAFSLVAGALERSGSTPTATLKMELMQGLVKMAWGSTSDREGCDSRGSTVPAREPGTERTGGGNSGGAGVVNLERPAPTKPGSSEAAERSDSADGARRSETELDSGGTGMDGGHRSPRSGAASVATAGREKSGGARDIFNIPYTEQVGWSGFSTAEALNAVELLCPWSTVDQALTPHDLAWTLSSCLVLQLFRSFSHAFVSLLTLVFMTQLSHGLVGGEKDKFYEDLEVRTSCVTCVTHGHEVWDRQGSDMINVSFLFSLSFHVFSCTCPAEMLMFPLCDK